MNNFPIESPTDLFGNGLLGSCNSLFDTQLNFMNDMSLIHDIQPHLAYYSGEIQTDFSSLTTSGFDISLGNTSEQAMTFVNQPEVSAPGTETVGLVDSNAPAVIHGDTADKFGVIEHNDDSVSTGSADVVSENVAGGDAATEATNGNSSELLGHQNAAGDLQDGIETSENNDEPIIDISISNVVCAFNTRCYLSLKRVALEGMNVEYKKATGTVLMKIRKPMVTANIWASGKVTCTGSRSEEEARVAARRVARCLQRIYENAKFSEFRVVNVLGTCSLPFGIRITDFSRCYPKEASYEPEIHPGVTYRIVTPKATLKIFSTGSITITAPRISNVQRAVEHIYPLVVKFRMDVCKKEQAAQSSACNRQPGILAMNSLKRPNVCYPKAKYAHMSCERSDDSDDDGFCYNDNK